MRLGILQSAGAGLSPAARIEKVAACLDGRALDLLVCPELFLTGYNVGDDLQQLAEPFAGPRCLELAEVARQTQCAIVFGYAERDARRLYNSAAFVSPQGELLANHRKRLNSPGSFEERYFDNGHSVTLIDYLGTSIALLICYEIEFPESARRAAAAGAQLILVPTALAKQWNVVATKVVPARAFENGVWIAYANHAGSENGIDYYGGSRVVAPDGTEAALAGAGETLIAADVTLERVTSAQTRLPYLRDYQRL